MDEDDRGFALALDLEAASAAALKAGARVEVRPKGRKASGAVEGRLELDEYPTPGKGGAVYRARVLLDAPLEDLRVGMPAEVMLGGAAK